MAVVNTTTKSSGPLHQRLVAAGDGLAKSERHVAEYILANAEHAAMASAAVIGRETETSDATVVRAVKSLGYSGLRELRLELLRGLAARGNPEAMLEQRLESMGPREADGLDRVLDDTSVLLQEMRAHLQHDEWKRFVALAIAAPRIVAFGIGSAAVAAEYLHLALVRAGIPSMSITETGFRLADDLVQLRKNDLIVLIVPLRRYVEIDVVLSYAKEVGANTAVLSENLALTLKGKSTIAMSTPRTSSGTASEVTAGLVISHALVLAVASAKSDAAKTNVRQINSLRRAIVGDEFDISWLSPPDPS